MNQNSIQSNLLLRPILCARVKIVRKCSQIPHELDFFCFFQGDHTLSRKKLSEKPPQLSWMHVRAIQCKQAAYTSILTKVGNGRHVDVRAWAENIANAWLPIQTWGNFKGP